MHLPYLQQDVLPSSSTSTRRLRFRDQKLRQGNTFRHGAKRRGPSRPRCRQREPPDDRLVKPTASDTDTNTNITNTNITNTEYNKSMDTQGTRWNFSSKRGAVSGLPASISSLA
ncbi:hypothetical protein QC764_0042920 [Podospora pseudoanserina]|uniref:Uncharacterized protein n=1 Tax=Podospora pseudoanserina TaxID=2609844 RepID=A0ABR0IJK6_9PEZI|nr:hypothetical protein QC764_0042920 [Podospora pseudoanserina]